MKSAMEVDRLQGHEFRKVMLTWMKQHDIQVTQGTSNVFTNTDILNQNSIVEKEKAGLVSIKHHHHHCRHLHLLGSRIVLRVLIGTCLLRMRVSVVRWMSEAISLNPC